MPAFKDLTGIVFGKLTVIRMEKKNGKNRCFCECHCGVSKWILAGNLSRKNKSVKSCGCVRNNHAGKENPNYRHGQGSRKNGKYGTRTHRIWRGMLYRCYSKTSSSYKNYGERGIKVCASWLVFENFWQDMGDCPGKLTLDRINNNGNYEPENCRWATVITQARNKRINLINLYFGELLCTSEAAEKFSVNYQTLIMRLNKGEDPESAVTRRPYEEKQFIKGGISDPAICQQPTEANR